MLLLKLTLVPLFIAAVTLAGRRWGAGVAGLLGGFPVVAGPIVLFLALEQGPQFGALAATAAISAIAGLLVFAIAYCWASIRWPWPAALGCALVAWLVAATGLALLPTLPQVALAVAGLALVLTPRLLPRSLPPSAAKGSLTGRLKTTCVGNPALKTASKCSFTTRKLRFLGRFCLVLPASPTFFNSLLSDLPYRMITGALLTLAVTSAAATLGEVWSGLLAVFPIIGLVLAVFTHRAQGPHQVAHMYRGMVRGLYSFAAFFLLLALLWPQMALWPACPWPSRPGW